MDAVGLSSRNRQPTASKSGANPHQPLALPNPQMNMAASLSRRQAMATALAATGAQLLSRRAEASPSPLRGSAEHVISIWLGGGMGQIDTFDPKAVGDPQAKKAGSYYRAIETSVKGVSLCEHLPQLAERMERVTAV